MSEAIKVAMATRLKTPDTRASTSFGKFRCTTYQPSTSAGDPDPLTLTPFPKEEPGWDELSAKKVSTASILQSTTFTMPEAKDLWMASRGRLAISSTQDWAVAATHRAVAHVTAQLSASPEDDVLREQLSGIRQLVCLIGKDR